MRTLADHIQDIAYNSIKGNAKNIELIINFNTLENEFSFKIIDDGDGIPKEKLEHIFDPFYTTRNKKIRSVGLGLSLLKQNAELAGGSVNLTSKVNIGTTISSSFKTDNVDIPEIGDLVSTILALITAKDDLEWNIVIKKGNIEDNISTLELKEILGTDIPLNNIQVMDILKNIIQETFENLKIIL
ncbi:MAG: hypothetical protein B6I28_03890 [Fusobacteriia bacterium 4572_132]|nr:MAG: hypothetical protein B6I28_03890 [Fusobacteriia bacterium 4572_132]